MKKIWAALLLTAALAAGPAAMASQPGLGPTNGGPVISVEAERGPVAGKYPVWKGGTALQRARINSAIEAELSAYYDHIMKLNENGPVTGTIAWDMGENGKDGVVSFVLYESTYPKGAAHPTTYVKGLTFDSLGYRITRHQVLYMTTDDTADEIDARVKAEAAERQIPLFPDSFGRPEAWPQEFYIGRDGKLYFVFQQYDIAPYAAGWIAINPTPVK